jgi:hypothetical protein
LQDSVGSAGNSQTEGVFAIDEEDFVLSEHLETFTLFDDMNDNNDGTYTFVFPSDWIHTAGRYDWRLVLLNGQEWIPEGSIQGIRNAKGTARGLTLFNLRFHRALWTEFQPIVCHNQHAFPAPSGARCLCKPGHAPAGGSECDLGDGLCECDSCAEFGPDKFSPTGESCISCPLNTHPGPGLVQCHCNDGTYSIQLYGSIECHGLIVESGVEDALLAESGSLCRTCPPCLDCQASGEVVLRPGWAFHGSTHDDYKCPDYTEDGYEGGCMGGTVPAATTNLTLFTNMCALGYSGPISHGR